MCAYGDAYQLPLPMMQIFLDVIMDQFATALDHPANPMITRRPPHQSPVY
jgi:hypothetical protein